MRRASGNGESFPSIISVSLVPVPEAHTLGRMRWKISELIGTVHIQPENAKNPQQVGLIARPVN